ncbi:MAG: nitroreductase family protein [Nanoarchaeota archaeon]|nr:nitroreductase family protein [Nanoarchaeota archaeon]
MEFDSTVKDRKSVRDFDSTKKVSWKMVLDAIDAAIQGPFAGNNNYLRFLIIEDSKTIGDVAKLCEQTWVSEAPMLVLVCSDDTHLENLYGERGRVYSRQQAGAAIQTLLFKLTDLGLGSCWVGSYTDESLKKKLKIPQHIQIEAVVPVGYEKKMPGDKSPVKKSLENSLFWETWGQDRRPTLFEEEKEDYRPGKGDLVA